MVQKLGWCPYLELMPCPTIGVLPSPRRCTLPTPCCPAECTYLRPIAAGWAVDGDVAGEAGGEGEDGKTKVPPNFTGGLHADARPARPALAAC